MAKKFCENNTFTFMWRIENFNFCRIEDEMRCPLFSIRTSNTTSWYLSIWPTRNFYDFYLNKKRSDDDKGTISYKIDITDDKGKILHSAERDKYSFSEDEENESADEESDRYIEIFNDIEIINVNTIIIGCILILPEIITDDIYAGEARTKLETEQCSFKWNVKNFSIVDQVTKVFYCSQSAQFKITLSKCGGFVSIFIERIEPSESIFIVCKIALLDLDGIINETRKSEYLYNKYSKPWRFPDFIKTNDIFSTNSKYLEYDRFSLMCEFSFFKDEILEKIEYCHDDTPVVFSSGTNIDSLVSLQENFRRMYVEHLQTDVKIHAGKQILHAHKFVLSARSPVFAAMFDQDMLENQTGVVDIPDIEVRILDLLLRYMYDGSVDNLEYDSACKLLMAADKYQVPVLKGICSAYLMSNLNYENVCDVLTLADKVVHKTLKDSAVQYIVAHADKILPSEDWSHFIENNNKLVTDVMRKLSVHYTGQVTGTASLTTAE